MKAEYIPVKRIDCDLIVCRYWWCSIALTIRNCRSELRKHEVRMLEAVHKVKTSFIAAIFLLAAERNERSTMFYFRIVGTLKTGTGNEERIVVTVSFTPVY